MVISKAGNEHSVSDAFAEARESNAVTLSAMWFRHFALMFSYQFFKPLFEDPVFCLLV